MLLYTCSVSSFGQFLTWMEQTYCLTLHLEIHTLSVGIDEEGIEIDIDRREFTYHMSLTVKNDGAVSIDITRHSSSSSEAGQGEVGHANKFSHFQYPPKAWIGLNINYLLLARMSVVEQRRKMPFLLNKILCPIFRLCRHVIIWYRVHHNYYPMPEIAKAHSLSIPKHLLFNFVIGEGYLLTSKRMAL